MKYAPVLFCEPADKPGYVVNDHLSRPAVASRLKRPTLRHDGPPYGLMCGLASDGVYMAWPVTRPTVVSYTAFPPLLTKPARGPACRLNGHVSGLFLLHFPWGHPHRTLSGILPCEARTFLTCILSVMQPRSFSRLGNYYITFQTLKQLFPINSLKMEFFGIFSLLIPRK